jgi:NAD+ synthase (glutamine-hydrolysing)
MKIALVQINSIVGNFKHNFLEIKKQVKQAIEHNVNLLILPELALVGYPPRDIIFKSGFIKQQNKYLNQLAQSTTEKLALIVGCISPNEGSGKPFFNSLAFMHEGKIKNYIHKTLLPSYDVFDEQRYFESAKSNPVIDYMGLKLGLSICEDIWIENYASLYKVNPIDRLLAGGAQIIINAAASPYSRAKVELRKRLFQKLVKKTKVPLLYVNQVGANDQLIFDGNSLAINVNAEIIKNAAAFKADYLELESSELIDSSLKISDNHDQLSTKAIGQAHLAEIYQALCLGLKDYVHKTGFKKVILGLSGGIDSALVAKIAVNALGAENVLAFMLPSKYTSQASTDDATKLASNLGLQLASVSIESLRLEMHSLLTDMSALAAENIQARLRASILLAKANTYNALLLSTSNKSELAVGYSTLYGDSCGALAVIGDLLKTEVFSLVKYINELENKPIPKNIITKPPSAELREDQKDSDSLPDYEVLDQIIKLYVEDLKAYDFIVQQGYDQALVSRILNLIDQSEYKRFQAPPVLKLTGRAFGMGRKMPIVQGYRHA